MAEISSRDIHVDMLLTTISLGYKNTAYIADLIAPDVPVRKQSDIIPQYEQSHWFRNLATLRAPGTESQGGGFQFDNTKTYYCQEYSWHFDIPDQIRDNTDMPYDLDRDGTMYVTDKLQMNRESTFANRYFIAGVWPNDQTGVPTAPGANEFLQFNDLNTNPIVTLSTYMDAMEGRIAREPNTLVMGKQVWLILKWHPDLVDLVKYTGTTNTPGLITTSSVASMLEMSAANRILIGRSIFTASPEGTPESNVTYSRIWGKNVLMLYVAETPSLFTPSALYTFVWQRVPNAKQYIKRMRIELREVDRIEGNTYYDQRQAAANAGQMLLQAVA